ncbi:MAG TPA: acyloxyacyl hydrolase [Alphaproteobacteria bacterium]|nr:acyloxyacyl hydrolase [Alphaproteobacteria bacterium]
MTAPTRAAEAAAGLREGVLLRLPCLSLALAGLALLLAGTPAMAGESSIIASDDPAFLDLQLGTFDIRHAHTFVGDLEYRSSYKILGVVKPMAGFFATGRGAFYGYGGFAIDLYFGRRIVVTPSEAIGGYYHGNDVDLGAAAPEFRSAIEIAYRFDDRSRLGIMFHHISNAGIGRSNPGAETALVTYSYPLPKLTDQLSNLLKF